jgi:hypothetical protein
MSNKRYIWKLKNKIRKITNQRNIINDDLHRLFHYYDLLDYYDYYENEKHYKDIIVKYREELMKEGELVDL